MVARRTLLLGALVLAGAVTGAGAQGLLTERGFNGMGASTQVVLAPGGVRAVSLSGGYSISGILDLGMDIGVVPGVLEGSAATDLGVSGLLSVIVLKQTPTLPFSLQLTSSYGLVTTESTYLTFNHLTRRGFRYSFGAGLHSSISFTRAVGVQLGVVGSYASTRITTEPLGTGVPGYPRAEREQALGLGGEIGLLLRDRSETAYRIGLRVLVDQYRALTFTPTVSVVVRGM
jgi:hypothetical protein